VRAGFNAEELNKGTLEEKGEGAKIKAANH
jgi:hypothetical protein